MATSGTYAYFNIVEVVEDAYERAGYRVDRLTARHLESARRSMNDIFLRWSANEVNVWKIAASSTTSVTDQATYTLGTSATPIIDVLNVSIRDSNNNDQTLDFLSQADYQLLPNKTAGGRPTSYTVFRNNNGIDLKLYPVPEDATLTITYHTINYVQEVGNYDNDLDLPKRMLPALTAGLAWQLAMKRPKEEMLGTNDPQMQSPPTDMSAEVARRNELKDDYLATLDSALRNDREFASFFAIPYLRTY